MSEELTKAANLIMDIASHVEEKFADHYLLGAVKLARHYLSPPAAGPGFDVEFLAAVDAVLAEQKAMTDVLGPCGTTLGQLHDRLRELRAALGTGWRDIATAPKDGAEIVLYHRLWEGYVRHGCCRDGVWIAECGKTGWYAVGIPPSHWMPLPPDPAPNEGGAS